MSKLRVVPWLLAFCLSSVVAAEKPDSYFYTWRCIHCGTLYLTNSKSVPDSQKCDRKNTFHTWVLEKMEKIDEKPKQPKKPDSVTVTNEGGLQR